MSVPWDRVKAVFKEAVSMHQGREEYLQQACGDDTEMLARVHALLDADRGDDSILDRAAAELDSGRSLVTRLESESVDPTPAEPPASIGPYRLLERLGAGGMGDVWKAEQDRPVRRTVALKLIKAGMDTKEVIARFESERQALALMEHSTIAQVFDAGATAQGRPYFVMEYVQGAPITQYCDSNRLSTRERLALLMQVCDGVQHAHQKGVIHRDLKPANVLVKVQDGQPLPKIIDFGIAKATDQRLTEGTLFTGKDRMIGTPEYMSPEQAGLSGLDVDTRTDVYSLGVMLYELLVGERPFDSKALREGSLDEIRKKVCEEEPLRPSQRLSGLGEASTATASRRRTNPPTLRKQLAGDLDWIVMRALEKDRTRRYPSVSEFALDIARHLNHEPVLAGPPSNAYRIRKFVRRHRLGVTAAGVALTMLILGIVGTGAGMVRAVRAERRAVASEREAQQEAETANRVSSFMTELFRISDPSEARGNAVTAREILDRGSSSIGPELAGQPLVQSRLMQTMGVVYQNLGLYAEARPLLEGALEKRRLLLDEDHPRTLDAREALANLLYKQGDYDEAEGIFVEALQARRSALGPDDPATLSSMNNLAVLYRDLGRYDEAEQLYLEAIESEGRGAEGRDLDARVNLAHLYMSQGLHDKAEPLFVEVLGSRRRISGEDHPDTLNAMNFLAVLYKRQSRESEAEALYVEALETRRRVLGEDHPDTLASMNNLSVLYSQQGRDDEAERLAVELLETQRRTLGDTNRYTSLSMMNLASLYKRKARYDEAEKLLVDALSNLQIEMGQEHPETLECLHALAGLNADRGHDDEAREQYVQVLDSRRRVLGPEHPATLTSVSNLAILLKSLGRYDEAEPLYRETLEARRRVFGADHMDTLTSINNLAVFYGAQKRYAQAAPLIREALETARRLVGDDHRMTRALSANLGVIYMKLERYDEAEPIMLEGLEASRRLLGPDHPSTLYAMSSLGQLNRQRERYGEAEPLLVGAVDGARRVLGEDHLHTLRYRHDLAALYVEQGRYDEAGVSFRDLLETSRRVLGEDHPSVARNLEGYADLLRKTGDVAEAARLEARAEEIRGQ